MSRLAEGAALARRGLLWMRTHGGRAALGRAAHWLVDRRHPRGASYESWLSGRSAEPTRPTQPSAPRCHLAVSVIVPVHDPLPGQLRELVASVREQDHPRWELVLVDDASRDPEVRDELERLGRLPGVRVERRPRSGGISVATNVGAARARGEVLLLVDHDDVLAPGVVARIAAAFDRDPRLELLYTDEDQLDERGRRVTPSFKAGPSPWSLLACNTVGHLMAVRRGLWVRLGGLRSAYDGAQDHDLALRAFEQARRVGHLPVVGYHWRRSEQSVSTTATNKPWAYAAGGRAILDAYRRRGIALASHGPTVWPGVWRASPVTQGELAPDVVLYGGAGAVSRWERWLRAGVSLPTGGRLLPRRVHAGSWPDAAPAGLWVLDANMTPRAESLAALAGWSAQAGVGAAVLPRVRGVRRLDAGFQLSRRGRASAMLPGLHVAAAGPAWWAAGPREVAAGKGALALPWVAPAWLAALRGRAVHPADVLALSATPALHGESTLLVPGHAAAGRLPRPAWPDRLAHRPRPPRGESHDLTTSPLWSELRAGLPDTFWRGGADRFGPVHELLTPLGVPAGAGAELAVWCAPGERTSRRVTPAPTRSQDASSRTTV